MSQLTHDEVCDAIALADQQYRRSDEQLQRLERLLDELEKERKAILNEIHDTRELCRGVLRARAQARDCWEALNRTLEVMMFGETQ